MNDAFFGQPYDREDLTISTAVVPLTAAKYRTATRLARNAVVTVEGQPIRYTRNGTNPDNGSTPAAGDVHAAGNEPIVLRGYAAISQFKAIRQGGTDAVLHVTYFL